MIVIAAIEEGLFVGEASLLIVKSRGRVYVSIVTGSGVSTEARAIEAHETWSPFDVERLIAEQLLGDATARADRRQPVFHAAASGKGVIDLRGLRVPRR